MASRDLYPQEILQVVLDKSCAKAQSSVSTLAVLSVLAGGYIGFGYLAYLKVVSGIPHEWGGLATLLGASMFPIALICILLGGGELVTSNMMIMSLGRLAGRISTKMLLRNWVVVCLGNLVGTLAMAFFLGHYVGMTEGSVAEKTIAVAEAKVHMDFGRAFVSAVACNWMVCMGAWLHFAPPPPAGGGGGGGAPQVGGGHARLKGGVDHPVHGEQHDRQEEQPEGRAQGGAAGAAGA